MRLTPDQIAALRRAIHEVAPEARQTFVFGSRIDDSARGGDVDVLVNFDQPVIAPAALAARVEVRAMRALGGRKVDVVLRAPNLVESEIHRRAMSEGVLL